MNLTMSFRLITLAVSKEETRESNTAEADTPSAAA
jgi:hypothetical protein